MKNGRYNDLFGKGSISWFKNDNVHREDGPAIIYKNGDEEWVLNGAYHRLYAPALILNGREYWYINGYEFTYKTERWIKENNYPHWSEWDDATKIHWKLSM